MEPSQTDVVNNINSLAHTATQTGLIPLLVAFMIVLVVLIIFAFIWMVKKAQDSQERMIRVYQDSLKTLTTTHENGMNTLADEIKIQGKALNLLANKMARIEGRLELSDKEKP